MLLCVCSIIRDELKELKKGGDTAHSKEKESTLNALRAYTAFSKLRATGDRNLLLAEATAYAAPSSQLSALRSSLISQLSPAQLSSAQLSSFYRFRSSIDPSTI